MKRGKHHFLDPGVFRSVNKQVLGYPVLAAGLETTLPRLHVIGAPAAWSFGPLMQFVSGTGFAARELARTMGHQSLACIASEAASAPSTQEEAISQLHFD